MSLLVRIKEGDLDLDLDLDQIDNEMEYKTKIGGGKTVGLGEEKRNKKLHQSHRWVTHNMKTGDILGYQIEIRWSRWRSVNTFSTTTPT